MFNAKGTEMVNKQKKKKKKSQIKAGYFWNKPEKKPEEPVH